MEGLSDQLQTAAGIKGIDGYLAAFPNALRGLEGRRLRNVVEAVHSGVLEGWRPTEENVAAIAQSRERGPMTPERAQAICDRVRARRNDQKRNRDNTPTARGATVTKQLTDTQA